MPLFDYYCERCEIKKEIYLQNRNERESIHVVCETKDCHNHMKYIVSSGTFKVRGYNAKNGYSGRTKR